MYKILFVDDEQNILQYLPVAIDWQALKITEMRTAGSGREALAIAADFKPDIAIVDVEMPGMDGLEFCRKVFRLLPDLAVVILSAFDRFDYAKRAIAAGVKDYILKPVDESELEELMKKILKELEQSKDKSQNIEKLTQKALEKELKEFSECLINNQPYTSVLEADFPFLAEYPNISILIAPDMQLLFSEEPETVAIPFEEGFWFFFWKHDPALSMRQQVEAFEQTVRRDGGQVRFFYTRKKNEESVTAGLKRCFEALEMSFYSQEYHIEARQPQFNQEQLPQPELGDALNALSEEADITLLDEIILREVTAAFARNLAPAAVCRMIFDSFITLKIYLTKCWQEEAVRVFRQMSVWSLLQCGSQENLLQLIRRNLDELQAFVTKQKESHGNFYIVKVAKNYTKQQYQDPALSLQQVADAVGISRTYFSKTFKELTGEKYWDYLTRYRIEQAKLLLRDTNMFQAEISEKVGYNSEFHFSRKFKEIVGMSPNKYRKP